MPRHTRTSRFVAILAAGVVVALPLAAAGPAAAASPQVEFSGGQGLLSCDSRPSERDLTVPAESTVIFVNKLRDDATLRINGRDAAEVQEGDSRAVLFHHGTVRVDMVPDCGLSLSSDIRSVAVTVAAPGSSAPRPPSSAPASSSGSSPAGAASAPSSRGSHRAGTGRSASPRGSSSVSPSDRPAGGIASPPDAGAGDGAAAGEEDGVAAEPVSAETGSEKDGPSGLLTIIAVVCVVGVSAGAIRAIAAQRASRTSVA